MISGVVHVAPPSVLRRITIWMLSGRSALLETRASAVITIVPSFVTARAGMRTEATVPS
jgi:hypothetical protein